MLTLERKPPSPRIVPDGPSRDTSASRAYLLRIVLAFASVYFVWGSTFPGIRVAIETIPPMLMGGVTMIVRPEGVSLSREQTFSIVLFTVGELMWSAAALYAGRARQTTPPFLMAPMQELWGGALMLLTSALRGEMAHFDFASVTLRSLLAMSYLSAIGSIVGFTAYLWLLRNVEPTRVATYAYVNPIVAVFLGSWLGGANWRRNFLPGARWSCLGLRSS